MTLNIAGNEQRQGRGLGLCLRSDEGSTRGLTFLLNIRVLAQSPKSRAQEMQAWVQS